MHVIHKQKNNCHASNTNYFSRMRKCFSRSHLAIQIFPDYDGYSSWKTKTKIRSKKRDASKNHYFKIIKGYFSLRLSLVIRGWPPNHLNNLAPTLMSLPMWWHLRRTLYWHNANSVMKLHPLAPVCKSLWANCLTFIGLSRASTLWFFQVP